MTHGRHNENQPLSTKQQRGCSVDRPPLPCPTDAPAIEGDQWLAQIAGVLARSVAREAFSKSNEGQKSDSAPQKMEEPINEDPDNR